MEKFKEVNIFIILLLSGCVLSPGQSLDVKDKSFINKALDESSWSNLLNIYNITPKLIDLLREEPKSSKPNEKLDFDVDRYTYYIGVGDVISITVFSHPELAPPVGQLHSQIENGYSVDEDGYIFYPFVGQIKVRNKSLSYIRDELTRKLSFVLEKPQVDVKVADFRSQKVYITGQVKKIGNQKITNIPLTVLDAINFAGGLEVDADWDNVVITRKKTNIKVSLYDLMYRGDLTQNHLLASGDIVFVPKNYNSNIFVMGEVGKQKILPIERGGMTLAEAIGYSEGLNQEVADASGIFVIRKIKNKSTTKIADVYKLDAKNASAMVLAAEFNLKAYDIVYVTTAPIVRWNRVINKLTPTINSIKLFPYPDK